jgi:hypothetical protein
MYGMNLRGVSELRDLEHHKFRSVGAEDFAAEMQENHSKIKEWLQYSNQEYKHREDQNGREIKFEVGDLVLAQIRKEIFLSGTYNKLKNEKDRAM